LDAAIVTTKGKHGRKKQSAVIGKQLVTVIR